MILTLARDPVQADPSKRTFGELYWADEQIILQTLERPWVPAPDGSPGGHPQISCVPAGTYDLMLHNSADHPFTWALHNPELGVYAEVEDFEPGSLPYIPRTDCLIHADNIVETLAGCVGVGLSRSKLNGEPDIADSKRAFELLKQAVPWTSGHQLIITEGRPIS